MNDNTTKLLEQLASKLGTTTEYLWRVLLKQAPISATTSVLFIVIVLIFGIVLWKVHKRLLKKDGEGNYAENLYEKHEAGAALPMIIGVIIFAVLFIIAIVEVSNVITGYFNPEYWALKEVLDSVK